MVSGLCFTLGGSGDQMMPLEMLFFERSLGGAAQSVDEMLSADGSHEEGSVAQSAGVHSYEE